MTRLYRLVLVLALVGVVFAARPPKSAPQPKAAQASLAARQMSRDKMSRLLQRKMLVQRGLLRPRQSGMTYPTCAEGSTAGFARFPGYQYEGTVSEGGESVDLSAGAQTAGSEAACLDICNDYVGCLGVTYTGPSEGGCELKQSNSVNSALTTAGTDTITDLSGTCESLEEFFDQSKMSVCCNTFDKYPKCSTTHLGMAQLPGVFYTKAPSANSYFPGDFMCAQDCYNNNACYAAVLERNNGECSPVYSPVDTSALVYNDLYDSNFRGTCNGLAASGVPSSMMEKCCNGVTGDQSQR